MTYVTAAFEVGGKQTPEHSTAQHSTWSTCLLVKMRISSHPSRNLIYLFSAFLPSIINMDTLKSGLTDFKKGAVKKYKQATGTLVHAVPRYIHKRAKKGKGNERGKE